VLHGLLGLLADRHGRDGVSANFVAPGMMGEAAAEFPDGWVDTVPMGRFGGVAEIAATVGLLLSDGAGYITGQTLVADGGVNRTAGL